MTGQQPGETLERFRIPKQVLFREVQGEAVVLHLDTNAYFRLDAIGTQVWLVMQEVDNLDELIKRLLEAFDAPEATVREDVAALLRDLVSHGLLEPVP